MDIKTKEGDMKLGGGMCWRWVWKELEGSVNVIKIHCINLQNSQRINKISLKLSYNSGYFGSKYLEGRLQDHNSLVY